MENYKQKLVVILGVNLQPTESLPGEIFGTFVLTT